jgi:signal transduction histidine kinase/ligand-binding sensor domain-containing protein
MNSGQTVKAFLLIIATFVVCFMIFIEHVNGQRFQTRSYTEADGLANSMVYSIVQDSSGVLWIARRSGISSYDGNTFTNYNITDGLRTATYAFLAIDEKQTLWALPEGGALFFARFHENRWESFDSQGTLPSTFTSTYTSFDVHIINNDLEILIGTQTHGFIVFRNKKWHQYTMADGLPDNWVNSIRRVGDSILIATKKGLFFFRNGKIHPVNASPYLSENVVAMDTQGSGVLMAGERWLGTLTAGKFTLLATHRHIHYSGLGRQCFIHAGRNGKIYFGNAFKVMYYDPKEKQIKLIDRTSGLITEGASAVLVDRELNIWIAGYRGITKVTSERFASFFEKDGLQSNEVASAMETSPGRYIFGHDGALTFFNGKTMTRMILDTGTTATNYESRVLDINKDQAGNIWMAVSKLGVARLDSRRNITWYREPEGVTRTAYTLGVSASGDVYTGNVLGLFRLHNGRFVKMELEGIPEPGVRKLFPDKDGTLYIATLNSGLLNLNGHTLTTFTCSDNRLANNVYGFLKDSGKNRWVGTAAGLYRIEGDVLKKVNSKGLCISRPVYLIIEDHQGNLWFGTDNGVYRWNGSFMDHFTVKDGLSGQDINRSAGFVDHKHHIWFGTNNGITIFRPELDHQTGKIPPPKVTLTHVISGNDTLPVNYDYVLPQSRHNLDFHTRVISLINEDQNYIRYYLEGYDTGWSNEQLYGCANINYNNLLPGSYRFHFKARNSLGTWSEPVVSATFKIRPPIFLRWWFLLISLVLFAGIIYLIARFVLVNRYKNQLEAEVRVRTAELMRSEQLLKESNRAKDSFFSIIAHDLRNPFNVILGYLDLLTDDDADYPPDEQKKILLKLKSASVRTIDLLENLLTWARSQRGSLPYEPEMFPISDAIDESLALMENAAQSKQISLAFPGERDLMVFADRNMINTVIRNLISNALKFTRPEGSVLIRARQESAQMVVVSIKDNGVGIPTDLVDRLFKIEQRTIMRGTANETGTGLGLILCKEFVEKNNGQIWVVSDPNKGTVFSISLPASKTAAAINPGKITV